MDNFLSSAPHGGLVVPLAGEANPGEVALVSITLEAEGFTTDMLGMILWIREREQKKISGVGFFSSEVEQRERLLGSVPRAYEGERREPRLPMTLAVSYSYNDSFILARTRNVSRSGLCIESADTPRGEVRISVYPGDSRPPVKLNGNVVWSRPGLDFGFLADDSQQALPAYRQVVEQLSRMLST